MPKKHSLLFGAHMSIAGGIEKAFERGESIGCTAMQIFTKSNRQWKAKPLTKTETDAFKAAARTSPIKSVIAHATYLINCGASDKKIEEQSVAALIIELERCEALGIPALVVHPGSHVNTTEPSCINRITHNLNTVLKTAQSQTSILLETMAGQGSSVCYTFEQIAQIINNSHYETRLGVCVDTCHVFAAGYDFRTKKEYETLWHDFDKIIGLKKLGALHINDSKNDFGSRVDRHANIGKGKIGLDAFGFIFNDSRFFDIPKILETPKDSLADDKKNMETIMSLIN